jgi:ketosteroid isomerase-like protein
VTKTPTSPEAIVMAYLHLCQDRDLGAAEQLLHPAATLTFPGPHVLSGLGELPHYARARYQFVDKTITRSWSAQSGDEAIVTVTGTLAGVSHDGRPFAGIRFIDVFCVRDGRITSQSVWNDLAEAGIVPPLEKGA